MVELHSSEQSWADIPSVNTFTRSVNGNPRMSTGVNDTSRHLESKEHSLDVEIAEDGFKFESRGNVIDDSRSKKKQLDSSNPGAFKCEYHGCKYRGTFKRIYDLNRHMKKHTERNALSCFFSSCDETFYRADKFRTHVLKHGDEDLVACPIEDCMYGPAKADLLKLHLRNHHKDAPPFRSIFQYYGHIRRCPLPSCDKIMKLDSLRDHLLKTHHTVAKQPNDRGKLKTAGFDADSLDYICPVCNGVFRELASWRNHIVTDHLVTDALHFLQFRDSFHRGPTFMVPWIGFSGWRIANNDPILCVHCLERRGNSDGNIDHQLQLLRNPQEIYPYRRAILALWPQFGTHPVFDDVLPQVYRAQGRFA